MTWAWVRLADVKAQPWTNGGGVTCELLALPQGSDWTVRISVAEVSGDGPFSSFPGVTRWFAVLAGAGVRLYVGADQHALTAQGAPLQFDGEAQSHCELIDGATQDFNLMVRGHAARMVRVAGRIEKSVGAATVIAAYAVSSCVICLGDERVKVPAETLAWRTLDADAALSIEGDGALWMEIAA